MNKKAQTEDIFADLFVSIVLIAIGAVVLGFVPDAEEKTYFHVDRTNELIAFLKTPVEGVPGADSMADLIALSYERRELTGEIGEKLGVLKKLSGYNEGELGRLDIVYPDGRKIIEISEMPVGVEIAPVEIEAGKTSTAEALVPTKDGNVIKLELRIYGDVNYG